MVLDNKKHLTDPRGKYFSHLVSTWRRVCLGACFFSDPPLRVKNVVSQLLLSIVSHKKPLPVGDGVTPHLDVVRQKLDPVCIIDDRFDELRYRGVPANVLRPERDVHVRVRADFLCKVPLELNTATPAFFQQVFH